MTTSDIPPPTIDDLSDEGIARLGESLGVTRKADEDAAAFRARVGRAYADDSRIDATPLAPPQPLVLGGFTLQGD